MYIQNSSYIATYTFSLSFFHFAHHASFESPGRIIIYQTIASLNQPESKSLLKTLWEREKMLVISSVFFFSHNALHPIIYAEILNSITLNLSPANAFSLVWSIILLFGKEFTVFTDLHHKTFENHVGKGEIARNEQFLLYPQCFLPVWRAFCHFQQI